MSLKNILKQRRSEIFKIAEHYGVHNIRLFGSVGKEMEQPDSDVDFLVDLETGRTLLDLGGMAYDLQQLLGRKNRYSHRERFALVYKRSDLE